MLFLGMKGNGRRRCSRRRRSGESILQLHIQPQDIVERGQRVGAELLDGALVVTLATFEREGTEIVIGIHTRKI